ncbi:MAG: YncE family protein [Myxococcota bacterium]
MGRVLFLLTLLIAAPAQAEVTLQPGREPDDLLPIGCGVAPPALERDPFDPNRAFVACSTEVPGASSLRIASDQPLAFDGVDYFLPGNVGGLDCSESLAGCGAPGSASFGAVGNLFLDPLPGGRLRGWLTTSLCELVVPFDADLSSPGWPVRYRGEPRLSVPTKLCITGPYTTYTRDGRGPTVTGFGTNLTSDVLRVGDRLLVATSNFKLAGSNPELYPGTVLLFDIDDSGPVTRVDPASPPFLVTSDPNPTALTPLPGGLVAVTNTGLLDAAFPPLVTGTGSLDILDPAAATLLGSIPLGAGNPGGRNLAIDPSGSVAVVSSHTLRALVAVDLRDLDGLSRPTLDPTRQRPSCNETSADEAGGLPCLRRRVIRDFANPILLPPPPGAAGTAGFIVEVRFAASGDFLAATSFNDGGLALVAFDPRFLDRPHPLLPSRFGEARTVAATAPSGIFGRECCPGPMLLHAGGASGLEGSEVLWLTHGPDGVLMRARLAGSLPAAGGDVDQDGVEDAIDTCPLVWNPPQADEDGNGVGDVCQCGDLDANGRVTASDVTALRGFLADPQTPPAAPSECDLAGAEDPPACDLLDAVVLRRTLAGLSSSAVQHCTPALL